MVGGPGLLWAVGAESRSIGRARKRKLLGFLPDAAVDRSIPVFNRKSGFISCMAVSKNRGRNFMAVGSDSGLFEVDLVSTRATRQRLVAAGGSGDTVEDSDGWRPPLAGFAADATVHPRDVMDAYYTPGQYSRISAEGVTPWDPVSVNSRHGPHDWELHQVLSSYIPLSARDRDVAGYNHNNVLATRLDYHPSLSFYCSGDVNGNVLLWRDSEEGVVAQYRCSTGAQSRSSGSGGPNAYSAPDKISRVRFSPGGGTVIATDSRGTLYQWNAHRPQTSVTSLDALDKRGWDAVFLNSSSVVAVGGASSASEADTTPGIVHTASLSSDSPRSIFRSSQGSSNFTVKIFDLYSPPKSAEISGVCMHPSGGFTSCLIYDDVSRSIFSGSDKGEISVFDIRMQRLRAVIPNAHKRAIRAFAFDPNTRLLASGSSHGDVRLWTMPGLETYTAIKHLHPERTMMNNRLADAVLGRYGVTDLAFVDDWLYTCGSNGMVRAIPIVW